MPERDTQELTTTEPDDWDKAVSEAGTRITATETPEAEKPVNLSFCVAQFCHYFPHEFQQGQIGWRRFWLLYWQLGSISAIQRWNTAMAVRNGSGLFHTDEKGQTHLHKAIDRDFRIGSGRQE